ncbi:MAG: insulinase family protein [Bacteroidales bacterium]|nr:insulinase family protein [Bacteroidales bacterium]
MNAIDRRIAPEVRPVNPKRLPEVVRERLPNGVELVVLDSGTQPVNRITFCWEAGGADVDNRAAYHLMCMMLTEGTLTRSGEEIADIFETCGAWVNVEPGQHATLLNAYMLNHTIDEILPLLCDIVETASLPEEILSPIREKKASAVELSMKKVKTVAQMNSTAITFGEQHPRNRYALAEDYRAVGRSEVEGMYRKLIRGTVPRVYLCGRADKTTVDKVRREIGRISFGKSGVARRIIPASYLPEGDMRYSRVEGSMQTALRITIPTIPMSHGDFQLLRVAVFALGGYFGSRLMSNIREENGYTYGISASLTPYQEGSFVTIACEGDNRYAGDITREIRNEIDRLASVPMGEEELSIIVNSMMSEIMTMFDSPFSIMDHWIFIDSFGKEANNTELRMKLLQNVAPADIKAVAGKYLSDAPWLVATAGG